MSEDILDKQFLMRQVVTIGFGLVAMYLTRKLLNGMIEEMEGRKKVKSIVYEKLLDMGICLDDLHLTKHELEICSMIVVPSSIDVTWKDIGGLDKEIQTLKETVLLPIIRHDLFKSSRSKLLSFPKGVLLSGPPGCGKTMIAKATAKESGCILLNIDISVLHDMYIGESPKYVAGIFSLAEKLNRYSPVIVFIDEIDTLLASRSNRDHENTQQIKSIFMTNWDGLISSKDTRIVIIGATNLPDVIDGAVYRRMPIRIMLKLPDETARNKILRVLLQDEDVEETVNVSLLAAATAGMSGSDIKEFCSQSCMVRYRELFRSQLEAEGPIRISELDIEDSPVRSIRMSDFVETASLFANEKLRKFFDGDEEIFSLD